MAQKVKVDEHWCSVCEALAGEPCTDAKGRKLKHPHERRQSVSVVLVCDLGDYDDEHEANTTLDFALDGAGYELDVCGEHWTWCQDQLSVMIGSARRARPPAPKRNLSGRASRHAPDALNRKCPTCGAGAGARCVRAGGAETGEPHAARRKPTRRDPRQMGLDDA